MLGIVVSAVGSSYDSSASLSGTSGVISSAFNGFAHWDGVYFLHIAQHGYDFELHHAFFPGLPLLTRLLGYVSSIHAFRPIRFMSCLLSLSCSPPLPQKTGVPPAVQQHGALIRIVSLIIRFDDHVRCKKDVSSALPLQILLHKQNTSCVVVASQEPVRGSSISCVVQTHRSCDKV